MISKATLTWASNPIQTLTLTKRGPPKQTCKLLRSIKDQRKVSHRREVCCKLPLYPKPAVFKKNKKSQLRKSRSRRHQQSRQWSAFTIIEIASLSASSANSSTHVASAMICNKKRHQHRSLVPLALQKTDKQTWAAEDLPQNLIISTEETYSGSNAINAPWFKHLNKLVANARSFLAHTSAAFVTYSIMTRSRTYSTVTSVAHARRVVVGTSSIVTCAMSA